MGDRRHHLLQTLSPPLVFGVVADAVALFQYLFVEQEQIVAAVAKAKESLSTLRRQARRATQHSVKFLRWLRAAIRDQLAEVPAVLRLKALYAQL